MKHLVKVTVTKVVEVDYEGPIFESEENKEVDEDGEREFDFNFLCEAMYQAYEQIKAEIDDTGISEMDPELEYLGPESRN
jgi:hypothetical protein